MSYATYFYIIILYLNKTFKKMSTTKTILGALLAVSVAGNAYLFNADKMDTNSATATTLAAPPPQKLTNCEKIGYCGISETDFIKYVSNYRNEVWAHLSYTDANGNFDKDKYEKELADSNSTCINKLINRPEFDSRYVDMDIKKLENYLCVIKSKYTEADKIRMFFIRYDKDYLNKDYRNKNSIAMVPVAGDIEQLDATVLKEMEQEDGLNASCVKSPIANHNPICPPPAGCISATLDKADGCK